MPVTTAQLFLNQALQRACGPECVAWAIGQLESGHDGYHLRMLASASAPFNHFVLAELRDQAFRELGITYPGRAAAATCYATEQLQRLLAGERDVGETVRELKDVCLAMGYQEDLMDFYRLSFAHEDLQRADHTYYWDATPADIDDIIRAQAAAFLARSVVS